MFIQKREKRRKLAIVLFPILLILVSIYGLTTGSIKVSLGEIWSVLFTDNYSNLEYTIVHNLRLPRIIIGFLVGACLAVSGAFLQGVMKNPLADPGIIGVTTGAGLCASICMVALPQYSYLVPIASFIGAFITALVIYFIAWDNGTSPIKIVLAGVAISALLGAFQNGIMVYYSERVQAIMPWLSGGLNGRSWYHLEFIAPYAIVGLLLSIFAIRPANLLLLGDDSAKLLGQKVEFQRFLIITLSAFLAGAAVSVAGLVGFVGLVVPHMIRIMLGNDYRYLIPFSALGGAILVVFADTAARTYFDPIELPVGILLACVGAPFFLYLLKKRGFR